MYKAILPLKPRDLDFFEANGYLYVENFYNSRLIEDLQTEVKRLIQLIYVSSGMIPPPKQESPHEAFDVLLPELIAEDRRLAGYLYDATKKLPALQRLLSQKEHVMVCRSIKGMKFPGFAARGWGLRMDLPNESQQLTQLHQEFTSQLGSTCGLVFWSPLRDVTQEIGPIKLYPGSHRSGVFKLQQSSKDSRGLKIIDEDRVRRAFPMIQPEVSRGDCLVLDYLTLHESSKNSSSFARWSLLCRYFDFENVYGCRTFWKGGIQEGGDIGLLYPEFVEHKGFASNE